MGTHDRDIGGVCKQEVHKVIIHLLEIVIDKSYCKNFGSANDPYDCYFVDIIEFKLCQPSDYCAYVVSSTHFGAKT